MIATFDPELTADTRHDAEVAHASVGALVELLGGCDAGKKLTAALYVGLLRDVQAHLENVVCGLEVIDNLAGRAAGIAR